MILIMMEFATVKIFVQMILIMMLIMMEFVKVMRLRDVKIQQHVTITRTQRMMMILVFLLMVFVRLVQVRPMEQVL